MKHLRIPIFRGRHVPVFVAWCKVSRGQARKVRGWIWYLDKDGYPIRWNDGKRQLMHHLIRPPRPGFDIDHRNGDKLDARNENLRYATRSQNMQNAGPRKTSQSGHLGVTRHPGTGRWRVRIRDENGYRHLGYFKRKRDAVRVANAFRRRVHGKFFYAR